MTKRKFGALADFRQQPLDDGAETSETILPPAMQEVPAAISQPPAIHTVRGKGRPPGKRSNPQWKLYSHFLKKRTQREAAALLAEREDGTDLSDLLQQLLEKWISEQQTP